MQQNFAVESLCLVASTRCDPYLPQLDTPHGGEKQAREEDAVIRCHRLQSVTVA